MPVADRVRFVLVAPSHPGNIGAAARAIKSMGFSRLAVVAPRDPDFRQHADAIAFATHAADVLAQAAVHDSLVAACADCSLSFAMTGYSREFGPALVDLHDAAAQAHEHLAAQPGGVAFVFGSERNGLGNEDVERCAFACAIAADPDAASLNLAQAVQVAAYECRRALIGGVAPRMQRFVPEPRASMAQIEGFHAHFEQALLALGFLDPDNPGRLMPRLRRLFARAQPSIVELDILRGIAAAIIERKSERVGRKHRGHG